MRGEELIEEGAEADSATEVERAEVGVERLIGEHVIDAQELVKGRWAHRWRRASEGDEVETIGDDGDGVTSLRKDGLDGRRHDGWMNKKEEEGGESKEWGSMRVR
jgi:hypothetical protein